LATALLPIFHEFSFESEKSPADECRQIAQRWKDMAAAEGQSVSENYANGRFAIICDFNFSPSGGEFGRVLSSGSPLRKLEHLATLVFVAKVPQPFEMHMGNKQPVLVLNVESVQGPDGIAIPSLVWLYDIHDEIDDPFGGLMFESAVNGDYKFIPSIAYRKLSVLRPLACGTELNIIGNKIESGAQVVQSVSDDAHKFPWHGCTRLELERIVASFRISFNEDSVRASVDAHQETTDVSDVLFGPLDL
jgi:hypothetical protein